MFSNHKNNHEAENGHEASKEEALKPEVPNESEATTAKEPSKEAAKEIILEQKIVELEAKISEDNDKLLRTLAELDNVRRRGREEVEKSSKYAISNFAADLVVAVENFFLASDNAPKEQIEQNPDFKHFAEAVEMTKKELIKLLEKNHIKRVFPLNEKFDHHFHSAVAHVASEAEEGAITQVMQAGYTIGDRLIRPALVAVSKGKAA